MVHSMRGVSIFVAVAGKGIRGCSRRTGRSERDSAFVDQFREDCGSGEGRFRLQDGFGGFCSRA